MISFGRFQMLIKSCFCAAQCVDCVRLKLQKDRLNDTKPIEIFTVKFSGLIHIDNRLLNFPAGIGINTTR